MIKRTFIFYRGDPNYLEVWGRYDMLSDRSYSMTLTTKECIEYWCEDQGYYLVDFKIVSRKVWEGTDMESGLFNYDLGPRGMP